LSLFLYTNFWQPTTSWNTDTGSISDPILQKRPWKFGQPARDSLGLL
jgi:hypothetical protein